MRRGIIYQMEVPFREPLRIRGFDFGAERGSRTCAIIGSTRGNEAQQAFVCARLVATLANLEQRSLLAEDKNILVVPCTNPFSLNVQQRFWPLEHTDINRSFPGSAAGNTTERLADAILRVARTYTYGIQLCSFNQPGDFLPHVRVTHQSDLSDESLVLAKDFGLPFVVSRTPSPYDMTTLNYAWQACGTHAYSLYSCTTSTIDKRSADMVVNAVVRFLAAQGALRVPPAELETGVEPQTIREETLYDLRTERASGFLVTTVHAGDYVRKGQKLAQVLDAFDTHVLETLQAPVDGRVFFMRTDPFVQQNMVVLRIVTA